MTRAFLVWMRERLPVSVVIPAYDRAELIGRAITSVRSQSPGPPEEVIVVDDGSHDATAEIAERLGARVLRHDVNKGTAAARNSGVVAATQPWVALLDSDDEWLPHHLGALWGMRNGYLLVANSALRCAADPLEDRLHGVVGPAPTVLRDPHRLLYPGNIIPASAAMVRRDAVQAVGGFRPPDGVEDLDLWIRVLEQGPGAVSPCIGAIYHVHARQTSQQVETMQEGHLTVARRYQARDWWSPTLVERWRGHAAWNNVRAALRRRRAASALRIAAAIVAHPQRLLGAIGASIFRHQLTRGAAVVGRDGRPSVAMLSQQPHPRATVARTLDGRSVLDLAGRGRARAYLRLVRRPPAGAIAASRTERVLLRMAGIREVMGVSHLETAEAATRATSPTIPEDPGV